MVRNSRRAGFGDSPGVLTLHRTAQDTEDQRAYHGVDPAVTERSAQQGSAFTASDPPTGTTSTR
jgi:hypothetical protein